MSTRIRVFLNYHHYYIIIKGQRANPIFFSAENRNKYFEIINELIEETDIELFAYCLLTTEVHFDIFANKYPIEKFIHRLNTKYALYFNKKYETVGHVFQKPYKIYIVLDEKYLPSLITFIHKLPALHNTSDSSNYKYSSARYYEGYEENNISHIKKIPFFEDKKFYKKSIKNNKARIPFYMDSIGSKEDYLNVEKRKKGRISSFSEKRKKDFLIRKLLNKILLKKNISIEFFMGLKYKRQYKKLRRNVFMKLIKSGFSISDIARVMKYNKSTVGRILKKNEK